MSDLTPGAGSDAQEDPVLRKAATSPFQWIVNARAALADIAVGGGTAEVALWGKNILNNRNIQQFIGLNFGEEVGFSGAVIYERERTYGVDVTFAF